MSTIIPQNLEILNNLEFFQVGKIQQYLAKGFVRIEERYRS